MIVERLEGLKHDYKLILINVLTFTTKLLL